MQLSKIMKSLTYEWIQGEKNPDIQELQYDSRKIKKGDLFVCLKGFQTNGHYFIDRAVAAGAYAVLIQEEEREKVLLHSCLKKENVTVLSVKDTREALAHMAAAFYGEPSKRLRLIAITGTKGKTTTSYMIRSGLEKAGHKCGLIGTIGVNTRKRQIKCENTTPESLELHRYMKEMLDAGCDTLVMEVSSQALKLHRVDGILFDIGIFTNFGEDHIGPDEHESLEEYFACKKKLFRQCKIGIGNAEDVRFQEMFSDAACEVITFGYKESVDYCAKKVRMCMREKTAGMVYELKMRGRDLLIELPLPGTFNVLNSLAAIAALKCMEVSDTDCVLAMQTVRIPGRMERVKSAAPCAIYIDYAHNAMSLRESLKTLRAYCTGTLVVIFGCGGNRARDRRFGMGKMAGMYADETILTTDNPRYEDPEEIIADIECGIRQTEGVYKVITDREEAITYAVQHYGVEDIVLIAGKGHETYQEIKGVKIPMDDRKLVKKCTQILS